MKQILIIALLFCSIRVMAQSPAKGDSVVTVKLTVNQLAGIQSQLQYLYEIVKTSVKASAAESEQVREQVARLYPLLVADKPKEVAKPVSPKKTK